MVEKLVVGTAAGVGIGLIACIMLSKMKGKTLTVEDYMCELLVLSLAVGSGILVKDNFL